MSLDRAGDRLEHAVTLLERIVVAIETVALTGTFASPPIKAGDEALWNVQQVADYLKCSASKVYKAAEGGLLPCVRDGRSLRFEPESIRAYVRGRARRATPDSWGGA